jgi:outer membrane protein OmpA-like peptidoglycan-associated protein
MMSTGEPVDFFEEFIEGGAAVRTGARADGDGGTGPGPTPRPDDGAETAQTPTPAPAPTSTTPTTDRPGGVTPRLALAAVGALCIGALGAWWLTSGSSGDDAAEAEGAELMSAGVSPSDSDGTGVSSTSAPAAPTTMPARSTTVGPSTSTQNPALVEIALDGGGVVLQGVVGTEELRDSFVVALSQLLGDGSEVRNRIEVRSGAGTQVDISLRLEDRVLFDLGSADISDEFAALLDRVAITAELAPDATIRVSGHTDISGNDQINDVLSQARADAVADHLIARGVAEDRVEAIGYGSGRPIADNSTAEGRRANRRIDIEFAM